MQHHFIIIYTDILFILVLKLAFLKFLFIFLFAFHFISISFGNFSASTWTLKKVKLEILIWQK